MDLISRIVILVEWLQANFWAKGPIDQHRPSTFPVRRGLSSLVYSQDPASGDQIGCANLVNRETEYLAVVLSRHIRTLQKANRMTALYHSACRLELLPTPGVACPSAPSLLPYWIPSIIKLPARRAEENVLTGVIGHNTPSLLNIMDLQPASDWYPPHEIKASLDAVHAACPRGTFPFRIIFAWFTGSMTYVRAIVPIGDTTLSGIDYEKTKTTEGELYNIVELLVKININLELVRKQRQVLLDAIPKLEPVDRIYINRIDNYHAQYLFRNWPEPMQSKTRSEFIQSYLCPWFRHRTEEEFKEELWDAVKTAMELQRKDSDVHAKGWRNLGILFGL
ncbi:hypothetical protein P154DRAFT_572007 [Amniculicola lignicola CBS 123094]|uniref:Uncharacterized protein n=1 Tax=Amniculicola lignicola CBS 123094 TaxID=1392246 RepID=A0A6A5WR57_9PLEO|nr:hypothetical protein P154DRAFT_572007 [Amniculicola lignicola CBS 123094]